MRANAQLHAVIDRHCTSLIPELRGIVADYAALTFLDALLHNLATRNPDDPIVLPWPPDDRIKMKGQHMTIGIPDALKEDLGYLCGSIEERVGRLERDGLWIDGMAILSDRVIDYVNWTSVLFRHTISPYDVLMALLRGYELR